MQQNPHILHVMQILADLFTDRVDTFADTNTIVYYDPADGNRRFQPDVYVAFGVDAAAIRQRNGYLIWEVGKPPDFVLEVASESTAPLDIGGKRDLYAGLSIPEYWRFDASGGTMYLPRWSESICRTASIGHFPPKLRWTVQPGDTAHG